MDLDLQKPEIANYLGIDVGKGGVLDLLRQRTSLQKAALSVRAGTQRIVVLPTAKTRESSELMDSPAMRLFLQGMQDSFQSRVIILDLPPMLPSDDVIAVLPHIDCVLLVMAVGVSKASELEECSKHLRSGKLLRVVVNKATDVDASYYQY